MGRLLQSHACLFAAFALLVGFPSPGRTQGSTPINIEISVDSHNLAVAKVVAYAKVVETAVGQPLVGTETWTRFDDAKRVVMEEKKGVVSLLDVQEVPGATNPARYRVAAMWAPGVDIRRDSRALRVLLDAMANPSVLVLLFEANMNREVLRPISETRIKNTLVNVGFRVQAAPRSYLDHLEEIKKQFEFRRRATLDVTVTQPLGGVVTKAVDSEYVIAWRDFMLGQGNDKEIFDAARSVGATYVLVGDCYTEEIPIPPAAAAFANQGYKLGRAYVNFQVLTPGTHMLAAAETSEATEMDLSLDGAGNKAITTAATTAAEQLVYTIVTNIQIRDLQVK